MYCVPFGSNVSTPTELCSDFLSSGLSSPGSHIKALSRYPRMAAAQSAYVGTGVNGTLTPMETAFADIHAMVVQATTYSNPPQVPASWDTGVSLEAIFTHLQVPYTMAQAVQCCGVLTVRAPPMKRGVPGRPLRLHIKKIIFPVADPGCPGHFFAPGHYVHVEALFLETWSQRIIRGGNELTRLAITPSGAIRSQTDGPPELRPAASTVSLLPRRSRSIGRRSGTPHPSVALADQRLQ